MTFDISRMMATHDLWSVYADLGLTPSPSRYSLVIPKPYRKDVVPDSSGSYHHERTQIIVAGFAWTYVADGAADGFLLSGTSDDTDQVIWEEVAGATGRFSGSVTPCAIPLQSGGSDSPLLDPGSLVIDVRGCTSGTFIAWGWHGHSLGTRAMAATIDYTN